MHWNKSNQNNQDSDKIVEILDSAARESHPTAPAVGNARTS